MRTAREPSQSAVASFWPLEGRCVLKQTSSMHSHGTSMSPQALQLQHLLAGPAHAASAAFDRIRL